MPIFQIIPILALVMYFFYMTYYYAAPMFWLKVLLFFGHIRYRGADIRFTAGKIIVRIPKGDEEAVYERPLDLDPLSRHLAMTACAEFRALLRDIRKGRIEPEACALSRSDSGEQDGERTREQAAD